jgi:hypothetical protein
VQKPKKQQPSPDQSQTSSTLAKKKTTGTRVVFEDKDDAEDFVG